MIAPPTVIRSSLSAHRMRSTPRSTTSSITILSAISHRSAASSACPMSWWSIHRFRPRRFPNSSPMPRPIRARSIWHRPVSARRCTSSGELFKLMTDVDMIHVPYRGDAPVLTDLLGGQVQVGFDTMPTSMAYIKAGKLRGAGGDDRDALGGAAGHADCGDFVPDTRRALGPGVGAPKNTPAEIVDRLKTRSMPGSPIRRSKRGLPTWAARCLRARPLTSEAHRRRNREVGQGRQVLRYQAGISPRTPRTSESP